MKKSISKITAIILSVIFVLFSFSACSNTGGSTVDGTYTYTFKGDIGEDKFTLVLSEGTNAAMTIEFIATDTYTGTYTVDGDKVVISGLSSETAQSPHPGLWAQFIDTETGDCTVILDKENGTFTFVETGAEGGIQGDLPIADNTGSSSDTAWNGGKTYDAVKYVENGTDAQTLDVYVPDGDGVYPLMVTIHGGAFKMGDSKMGVLESYYSYFRDNGYVCASLNYTLGSGTYPQAITDCKTAIQYLVDNAEKYHIDASNITVMGESAGAYLAIMSSITGADDFTNGKPYTYSVNNLVDFYGPVYAASDSGLTDFLGNDTTGANPEDYLKNGNKDIKIWIQHGTGDNSVNYKSHSEAFANTLKNNGYNVEYSTIDGAGHMDSAFYTDENLANIAEFIK